MRLRISDIFILIVALLVCFSIFRYWDDIEFVHTTKDDNKNLFVQTAPLTSKQREIRSLCRTIDTAKPGEAILLHAMVKDYSQYNISNWINSSYFQNVEIYDVSRLTNLYNAALTLAMMPANCDDY